MALGKRKNEIVASLCDMDVDISFETVSHPAAETLEHTPFQFWMFPSRDEGAETSLSGGCLRRKYPKSILMQFSDYRMIEEV
jgi:hypothetical protein